MIRFLSIQNLAVIDQLDLELGPGLTVLTGETGAGKSIVLGALGLLVGGRSTADLVRTGADRARVQATLEDEQGNELILRRDVTSQGRSRAFINEVLATATALQHVGGRLVDLHGQHEHQALLDASNHLSLLDAFAEFDEELTNVADAFRDWRASHIRLDQVRRGGRERAERIDLLTFQRKEIASVAPVAGEDATLLATRTRLANAERLATLCADAYATLYERDNAILAQLGAVWDQLEQLAEIDTEFRPYADGRASVEAQLEDASFFLRSYGAKIDASAEELGAVEERLAELDRLKSRYGPTLDDVLSCQERIEDELTTLAGGESELESLVTEETRTRGLFCQASEVLGQRRRAAADRLSRELQDVLAKLAIPHARFETRFATTPLAEEQWSERGTDAIEFYFSANPGETVRPLVRVVSGGELSRVMLGLKTLASTDVVGKTLVFDEVDAGIGGAAADTVGVLLRNLSERYQIICVTHLAQIAAHATSHFNVSKIVRQGRTVTRIDELAEQGRVTELARLMTGGDSPGARAGAEELLRGKQKTKGESESRRRKRG